MSLAGIAKKLFNLEKRFRKLTTDLQLGRASWHDVNHEIWRGLVGLLRVITESKIIAEVEEEEVTEYERILAENISSAATEAKDLLYRLRHRKEECMREGLSPRECTVSMDDIIRLENAVKKLTGSTCAWKVSNTFTSALNDLAACLHRMAEAAASAQREWKVVGKCLVSPDASDVAVDFCRTWDEATELMWRNELYADDDYSELRGWVVGDRVYLRVGSAAGHRTEVDFREGVVRYYDVDDEVNELMRESLERRAELSCNIVPETGVECRGLTRENYRRVAETLAFATSMDFRLRDCSYYAKVLADHLDEISERIERALRE